MERIRNLRNVALFACLVAAGCAADTTGEKDLGDDPLIAESAAVDCPTPTGQAHWLSAGHDGNNTRHQPLEQKITPKNVSKLRPKWVFTLQGDGWATPAVDETAVYIPDIKGFLYAVDRRTGHQIWRRNVGEITGTANAVARATPTIDGDVLYLGDQGGRFNKGASFFALNKRTGETLWNIKLDPQPVARVTQSATVHGDRIYIGLSSVSESMTTNPAFKCCDFRGNVVALDKKTGKVVWRTYLTPGPEEAPGYSGVTVWGSNPVVDAKRNSVYFTTGNNYTVPKAYLDCQSLPEDQIETCVSEVPGSDRNYFDAIVALDLTTGKVKWGRSMIRFDAWTTACVFALIGGSPNCPQPHGEDTDFGQGVIAYSANVGGRTRDVLAVGQKSGMFWAVSPDDGSVLWQNQAGPGGVLGGFNWGSSYDGKRIYAANANSNSKPFSFLNGEQVRSGFWLALDAATGKTVWQTRGTPAVTSSTPGSVTSANGVVFAGALNPTGTMYAFDAATGATLWSFQSGGSIVAGPAIVDGTVYWGSGYSQAGLGLAPNNKLYAFEVDPNATDPVDAGVPTDAGTPIDAGTPKPDAGPQGPSWRAIFGAYFADGTVGHCGNCHLEMTEPAMAYQWLTARGQISGTRSPLGIPGQSRLTWFGGGMPPGGPTSEPAAATAITAWIAAGALNN